MIESITNYLIVGVSQFCTVKLYRSDVFILVKFANVNTLILNDFEQLSPFDNR